jgi:hypothetical protein
LRGSFGSSVGCGIRTISEFCLFFKWRETSVRPLEISSYHRVVWPFLPSHPTHSRIEKRTYWCPSVESVSGSCSVERGCFYSVAGSGNRGFTMGFMHWDPRALGPLILNSTMIITEVTAL